MNFNMSATANAVSGGSRLSAGIHTATFQGVAKSTITSKAGDTFNVMALTVNIDGYGEYTQNFFEPKSAERSEGMYGENPSPLEQFLIVIREILGAVDPDLVKGIDDGSVVISGSFAQVVNKVKSLTDPYIGAEVEVKLLPQSNGFVAFPSFPARITRSGNLGIQTVFIGHDLTLSDREKRQIENAENAKPTNMASTKAGDAMLSKMRVELSSDDESEEGSDDLPF